MFFFYSGHTIASGFKLSLKNVSIAMQTRHSWKWTGRKWSSLKKIKWLRKSKRVNGKHYSLHVQYVKKNHWTINRAFTRKIPSTMYYLKLSHFRRHRCECFIELQTRYWYGWRKRFKLKQVQISIYIIGLGGHFQFIWMVSLPYSASTLSNPHLVATYNIVQ